MSLQKILRETLTASLPTAGAYGIFEYLLNNGEATKEFINQNLSHNPLALTYQLGLASLAAAVEYAGLRANNLWVQNRKINFVRQLANTAKWIWLEDISYWAAQAAITGRNPFPADNWWARVFGPVGGVVGQPTPIIQVPVGYVLFGLALTSYLVWEWRNSRLQPVRQSQPFYIS